MCPPPHRRTVTAAAEIGVETVNLGSARAPDLADNADRLVLAIPLGATEQHGPHLPLDTDTAIASELCRRLAARAPNIAVAPAIPYGSSGEHAAFPGTLSIGREAVELLLVELIRSADAFAGVVLVNGHGGNLEPLRSAVTIARSEGRRVMAWVPTGDASDSHAGHIETSVMLHLRPRDVAMDRAAAGNVQPLALLMDELRAHGVSSVSPNGVLGDPTRARAEDGERILARWTDILVSATVEWIERELR
ncbi:mycofactocin biosynthesis peptidyl-dipeptidase MftE [Nocardia sp. NPDC059246]|uniref:mycofactocin biosynthesis peptidyl-dipeptidase MftE n=1 Tax=unclassified Nocardia TaxID=2637762 RepID=UPI0036A68A62